MSKQLPIRCCSVVAAALLLLFGSLVGVCSGGGRKSEGTPPQPAAASAAAKSATEQAMDGADVSSANPGVYQQGKVGWYWYEEPVRQPEKEEPLPEEEKKEPDSTLVTVAGRTYEELWNMYPDDFQNLMNRTLKLAVQHPTEENVARYLVMQDIARRKSMAFASVVGYVGQKYPQFSNADTHPVISPGRHALARLVHSEITQVIEEASEDFALIMFTRRGCRFCDVQAEILRFFISSFNWKVRTVDIAERPDLALRFGIEQTPTIILVHRGSRDYMPISVGVVSLGEMNERIYRAIRLMRGETSPQQWYLHDFEKSTGNDPLTLISARRNTKVQP